MAGATSKKEVSVAEKLEAIFELQKIDSEIDRIKTYRGELPLEVEDLEDEVAGLDTRIKKIQAEIKEIEQGVSDRKNSIKDSEASIEKYKEQQNDVRNNREFESLDKEIEFQTLDIKLNEKRIKESRVAVAHKKEILEQANEKIESVKAVLAQKKAELDAIVEETHAEEEKLIAKSAKAKVKIDERLLTAYTSLRSNVNNGLAVVRIDRGCCGGCFNSIPPQRQLDIQSKRKIIVCEHCGRIIVPFED
ncbi:MAG TPA: C4-type zinc ribbon domain-containing protein [Crocinitomicaceae bacterium]|nr:C4-type zinc ribbon domain-containing protein [Crocinitomicaceae bacterium]